MLAKLARVAIEIPELFHSLQRRLIDTHSYRYSTSPTQLPLERCPTLKKRRRKKKCMQLDFLLKPASKGPAEKGKKSQPDKM